MMKCPYPKLLQILCETNESTAIAAEEQSKPTHPGTQSAQSVVTLNLSEEQEHKPSTVLQVPPPQGNSLETGHSLSQDEPKNPSKHWQTPDTGLYEPDGHRMLQEIPVQIGKDLDGKYLQ